MERFEYATPEDPIAQLHSAVEGLRAGGQSADSLTQQGLYRQATEKRIQHLSDFADQIGQLAVNVAMTGVADKTVSQQDVAQHLGVHPGTVTRWAKAARSGQSVTGRPRSINRQP